MFLSLCYAVVRWVTQLAILRFRSNDFKELEIVVLRHELAIVRRRNRRPAISWTDRLLLTAASRLLPRPRFHRFSSRPRRCCAGVGDWWRNLGRTRVGSVAWAIEIKSARFDSRDLAGLNRTGFIGGPIPREDVAHGPTVEVLPGTP